MDTRDNLERIALFKIHMRRYLKLTENSQNRSDLDIALKHLEEMTLVPEDVMKDVERRLKREQDDLQARNS